MQSDQQQRSFYVCRGSDCRKKRKPGRALRDLLSEHGEICEIGCQKICKGPVMGMEFEGQLEWFGRMASAKARKGIQKLLVEGQMTRPIHKRRSQKRSGKLRGLGLAAK